MATKHLSVLFGQRRPRLVLLVAIGSMLLLGGVVLRGCFPSHPRFGAIYEVRAVELHNYPADSSFAKFVRNHLPRRVVYSRFFPRRFKTDARYVDLGEAQMYWSVGGTNSGWLYFWGKDPRGGLAMGRWEFAPCAETDLMSVTEFPAVFYDSTYPALKEVFGETATTNAIKVSVGQIIFARWIPETNLMFVLRFGERHNDEVQIDYCVRDGR